MKGYHILLIAGTLLVVFGVYSVSQSFPNVNRDSDVTIPPGPYYYAIKVNAFTGLGIRVQYILESAGTVDVYVLAEDQYASFASTATAFTSLYAEENRSAGAFTFTFPDSAAYYVTFSHHEGITGDQQTMHLSVVASGTNLLFLAGGVGMIVLAAVLVVLAAARRKASRRAARAHSLRGRQMLFQPRGPR